MMNKTIRIRKAIVNDIPVLLQFEQGVIAAERPFDPTIKADPVHYYDLPWLITSDTATLVVAEEGGQVIASGYARKDEAKPFLQYRHFAYLGFMYVLPQYRGRGINQLVLDELIRWASSQGLTELRLDVYQENIPALKAYEKAGFTSLLVEMRKEISAR